MAGYIVCLLCASIAGTGGGTSSGEAERSMLICHDQPDQISPPKHVSGDIRSVSLTSSRPSLWLAEGRDFASRVSSRTSFSSRRPSSRRPTIGGPSEFRQMESPSRCTERFRPLELSIYLPGNELSPLPSFSEDFNNEPMGLGLPAHVLTHPRPASIVSRPSFAFTIPRKPVGSMRNISADESRYSIDSHQTLPSINYPSRAQSKPLSPKPPAFQSTQNFLDSLEPSLPKQPPPLHIRSGSEPVFLLHRRASDQNLRLRTHLEERQEIEKRLNEFDAISEEKQTEADLESLRVPSSLIKDITIDDHPFLEPNPPPNLTKPLSMTSPIPVSTPLHIAPPLSLPLPNSKPLPRPHNSQLQPRNSLATKPLPATPTPPRSRISLCRLRAPPQLPALLVSPTITSSNRGCASPPQSEHSSPPPLSRSGTEGSESGDSGVGTPGSESEVEGEGEGEGCKERRGAGEGGFAGGMEMGGEGGRGVEVEAEVEVGLAF